MSTTAVSTPLKTSALAVMAGRYNVEPAKLHTTLKSTVFKGASDDELLALVVVANEYQLNPFLKEIYAFPGKGGGIVPIVSVDGWNRLANNHPQMDGLEFEFAHDPKGDLISCTSIFYRKDRARPVKVTEYLSECARPTEPWKMKHRMLRHKALIQGARVAFGFGGLFDEDEARDIIARDPVANAKTVREATPEPQFATALTSENRQSEIGYRQHDDSPPGAEITAQPAPAPQTPIQRDIKTIRLLLKGSGHDDAAMLQLWRDNGVVEESLASLEEVGEVKPSAIRAACDPWSKTLDLLNASKAAKATATEGAPL